MVVSPGLIDNSKVHLPDTPSAMILARTKGRRSGEGAALTCIDLIITPVIREQEEKTEGWKGGEERKGSGRLSSFPRLRQVSEKVWEPWRLE